MTDEEKKAIKELTEIKELVEEDLKYKDYESTAILDQIDLESLVIVLNLIEKQEKELEKKDAVIDKMAEQLEKEIEWHYSEFDNYTKQDFIKHFTNLVEKENK